MPRGRPRKNPDDVLLKSAELIGWALGGIEREIETLVDLAGGKSLEIRALASNMGLALPGRTEVISACICIQIFRPFSMFRGWADTATNIPADAKP